MSLIKTYLNSHSNSFVTN